MATYNGTAGNDTFNGGAGDDTVTFEGVAAGYLVDFIDGIVSVTDIDSSDGDTGTDTLTGINTLSFADKSVDISIVLSGTPQGETPSGAVHYQRNPDVALLTNGSYVVVYNDSEGANHSDVFAQRYSSDGTAIGSPVIVNTYTTVGQYVPKVAALTNGGYVVTWISEQQDGSLSGIYAQRFDTDGNPIGSEHQVNTYTASYQTNPEIAPLPDGGYLICWSSMDQDGDGYGVYAQRFDAEGNSVGIETRLNAAAAQSQVGPVTAVFTDGSYVVAWSSAVGVNYDLYARRFDSNGNPLGVETLIHTDTTGWQSEPTIATFTDGSYVIAFNNKGDIHAQRFDAEGTAVGSPTLVNTFSTGSQKYPSIAALADGGYVIAWASQEVFPSQNQKVCLQRFDNTGNKVGSEVQLVSGASVQDDPVVTALVDGGYLVTYYAGGQIRSQRFDAEGNPYGPAMLQITGTTEADTLHAGSGDQMLIGGAGQDILNGGGGNDTYILDDVDTVNELAAQGNDTVRASITYTLTDNVENLTLTGSSNIDGTGNDLDNTLSGNVGSNILSGGKGNDTYAVSAGDSVVELADEGDDTVKVDLTYSLGDNVENLVLTGSGNINGTGNSLNNIIVGNSGNNILNGGGGIDELRGGLGNDTYILTDNDTIIEGLNAGTDTVEASISYVLAANLENLTLTGTADISGTGNSLSNTITGNSGNNTLEGGGGFDTLIGGDGDDIYIGGWKIIEQVGGGIDKLVIGGSANLRLDYQNVENLTLTGSGNFDGTGNSLNNVITGNAGNNRLSGDAGDDVLDGGLGADSLFGNLGNDTYVIDENDTVYESYGAGTDTVQVGFSYSLLSDFENLTLTGASDINGTGNAENNIISGNSGNNTLSGGTGVDTLSGGLGNDIYILSDADTVIENADEGTDTVKASVSYTLTSNVENLTLTGSGNINGTGNSLNNNITGTSGNNILDGGTGIDTLTGGLGNDIYVVDSVTDTLTENSGEGTDTVQSSVTFTLSSNFEHLTLTGSANINGTGNSLNNIITGNLGNNILNGGLGNDIYIAAAGDEIIEEEEAGTDTVQSSTSFILGSHIENLTLTGSTHSNGTGNALDNTITGNSGNNTLDGGDGNDTLSGGLGNDTYIVDTTTDTIIENTNAGTDTVLASITFTLSNDLENLTLTGDANINGTGSFIGNTIVGNSKNNTLDGGDGIDTLIGGSGNDTLIDNDFDMDTLIGGEGDDVYILSRGYDTAITEAVDEGTDTVKANFNCTLASNVENLVLTGDTDINGTGNALDNIIIGNSGNNTLSGESGVDSLIGGLGNDIYIVDTTTDTLTENTDEGNDTVQSSVTFTLGSNFENLALTGSANIHGIGNALNNTLIGNSGNNTLSGGLGDDLYIVAAGDEVLEEEGAGTDTVQSSATFTLGSNIENLTLISSASINGAGNSLNNTITGNAGSNTLDGGAGNDTLRGGGGNDALNGGVGTDIAVYSGQRSDYRVFFENGALKIQDLVTSNGNDGIDTLDSIETLRFSGGIEVATADYDPGEEPEEPEEPGPPKIGEFQVNTTTADDQAWSNVAALADGGFIMTWQSNDGDSEGIYAQRYDAYGNKAGSEFQVNTYTDLMQDYPVVSGLANGGFVMSWRSWGQDGSTAGVYAQVYNSAGSKVGGEFRVNVTTADSQDDPQITALTNGGFVVSWSSDEDYSEIYARVFNANGTPAGNEFRVNTTTGDSQWVAQVGALSNGGFVVSWTSSYQDGDDDGVYARMYDSAGNPVSGEFAVNTHTSDAQSHPSVAGLNDGGFIVCWTSQNQDGESGGIYAQRFNSAGAKVGGEFLVNTTVTGEQDIADVTALKNGGFVVTWSDAGYDGEGDYDYYGVYAQIYDASGSPVGDEFLVNTYVADIQGRSSVAALADGGFIINWTSSGQDGSGRGSYAQRYAADGTFVEVDGTVTSIAGDAGNNTLTFVNGPARFSGGAGNDTYIVRHAYDKTIENTNAGTDTVKAVLSWTLANNIENLSLSGTGNFAGTGNSLNNVLIGNSGKNTLTGLGGNDTLDGGTGIDTLIGGLGNDTYIIDHASDIITEATSAGTDTVRSSISKTLGANLENLILTGSTALNGNGNTLANALTGNLGNNTLYGNSGNDILSGGSGNDTLRGGTGKDSLTGGSGKDFFRFDTALSTSSNLDTIKDFKAADDTIQLENAVFKKLAKTGVLGSSFFKANTTGKATDSNDYIVYETDTGKLFYDADGNGKGAAIQFATLVGHPDNVTYKDFVVI